ncbi:MAG TPA: SRPBCC family protein [Candidatus Limnocylindrales bacterium]|jgi:hypothetical protein|nr:SRPBCC family protein [Candidatus Limnocylindrales bacterium]
MADYEQSTSVHATPSAAYTYLADPRHMPEYVATMTQARPSGGGHLHVAADVENRHEEGEATFRADPLTRRLEWGREGHDYQGWLSVGGGGGDGEATVTIHLRTHDDTDRAVVEQSLAETLANIERALSAG